MSQLGSRLRLSLKRPYVSFHQQRTRPGLALVRVVPLPDLSRCSKRASLLDHLVGEREQGGWDGDPDRLRRLDFYRAIEPTRLFDRQVVSRWWRMRRRRAGRILNESCRLPGVQSLNCSENLAWPSDGGAIAALLDFDRANVGSRSFTTDAVEATRAGMSALPCRLNRSTQHRR
jgi:hypothetical protein